ncbi:MAG: serine hydrolase [Steroidobacter sp.]|nr:serine hydrolase [Steroidobacter sp.]
MAQRREIVDYLARRPRVAPSGTSWLYATGDAHMLGPLLHAATGAWVCDYLSEKIWSKVGMENTASWWLDSPGGLEMCGSGLTATLPDYARFGLFMLNGAVANGESVLPDGWIPEATRPRQMNGKQVDYGYMWWPVADSAGSFREAAYSARGIFGQYIYINPAQDLVIVTLSLRAKPRFSEVIPDNDFFNAVTNSLR